MDINLKITIDFSEQLVAFITSIMPGAVAPEKLTVAKEKAEKPVKEKATKEKATETAGNERPEKITLEMLKAIGTQKANAGEKQMLALKKIVNDYGVSKVSALDEKDWEAAYDEIAAI